MCPILVSLSRILREGAHTHILLTLGTRFKIHISNMECAILKYFQLTQTAPTLKECVQFCCASPLPKPCAKADLIEPIVEESVRRASVHATAWRLFLDRMQKTEILNLLYNSRATGRRGSWVGWGGVG